MKKFREYMNEAKSIRKYITESKLILCTVLGIAVIGTISGVYIVKGKTMPGTASVSQAPAPSESKIAITETILPPPLTPTQKSEQEEELVLGLTSKPPNELIAKRKSEIASTDKPSRSNIDSQARDKEETKKEIASKPIEAEPVKPKENVSTVTEEKKTEPKPKQNKTVIDTTLNSYVLDVIKTFSTGSYPYLLNNDYANYNGVTTNLVYQDRVLLKAHPSGKRYSHCSGITFEVFFKAMQERNKKLGLDPNDFNGMSYDELFDFAMNWYVADGNKSKQNVARAVEKYGIGRRITNWEEAKAGDFIDLSRENNTGHTVVFINWIWDKSGNIIGLKYWSSQESTGGISYKNEYFNIFNANGQKYGNVMANYIYIARVLAVKDYK